jgi:uncharacterized secreted protein with C-terminal beta-propeller domain
VYSEARSDVATATAAISNFSSDTYGSGHSTTNVQETGVDESDRVKTDGQYLYIASDNAVLIVEAVPADSMNISGRIDVNGSVESLYLYNEKLVIFITLTETLPISTG